MKSFNIISILLLPLFLLFVSCSLEEPDLKKTPSSTGNYDFSKFVAIGNSLTAGYQSGSLVEDHQVYCFANLIATQLGIEDFQQPLVSWPGLPNIMTLESVTGDLGTAPGGPGTPLNLTLARPYDNLGIPGIVLADVDSALSTDLSYSHSQAIDLVLRGLGTQIAQALSLQPTLISCWIGNNDVLGFATSGGVSPSEPTNSLIFGGLYTMLGAQLEASGAEVIVANIPDVTSIPFFTTVGPMVAAGVAGAKQLNPQIPGLYYQKHGEVLANPQTGFTNFDEAVPPLITLIGGQYAGLLGQPTGKWWRDLADDMEIPVDMVLAGLPGLDTTQAFGFHPHNPWPDALILDADEIATAQTSTTEFNAAIASVASTNGFALVDMNTFFNDIAENDYDPGAGLDVLTTDYITGGLFSLDGVHPSNMGHAVVANKFIETLNAEFGTDIQKVNYRDISGKSPAAAKLANYDLKLMKKTVELMGGKLH